MQWTDLTSPAIAALSRDIPVVVPVAAVEQHGPHLPVATDSMLLAELVRRADEVLGSRAVFLPLLWLGNSHHHLDFAGTVSANPRLYVKLLVEIVGQLIDQGFRRIVVLNGHGGNIVPSEQALFEVRQAYRERHDLLLLSATYWRLRRSGDLPVGGIVEEQGANAPRSPGVDVSPADGLKQREMGHACEWETSMMLRIAPQLVDVHRQLPAINPGTGFAPAVRAWTTRERSAAGYIGNPAAATAEKGEALQSRFASDVRALIERMIAWDGMSWDG